MPGLRLAAAALLAALAFNTLAAEAQKPRPKVALVLSGGGARGLAHIGVLKVLHEARVPVDLIVATSMGSIVGGSYAAGNTPEHMEAMVNSADWDRIFSDRAPREFLSFRRKADDLRLIGKSELGVKDGSVVLPRGAFGSQNLEEFLRQVSHPASDSRTLNDLPILFRAVATDLERGTQVVLENVALPVAMRASMSIPGAFAPSQIDDRLLGDGGLVRNLPVEVAREMGADIIIAVNVGTPLLPREALSSALGVAQQMVNILTEQNVAISLAALRPNDILISPDLTGVTFVDFERGPDLILRGEVAAREVYARLAALGWEPARYAAWERVRTRTPETVQLPINRIVVKGAQRTNPEAILREVASRADLVAGTTVTDDQLLRAARILHGWGEFERVDVRAQFDGGFRNVVIDVDEKPWGPNYLRFGGSIISDFQTNATVQFNVQHTRTWVNSWGAEWRNEFGIGDMRRFATSFYQPLGPGSPWFVEPIAEFLRTSGDLFDDDYHRTDRIEISQQTYALAAGMRLGNVGVARLGAGYQRYKLRTIIGTSLANTTLSDSAKVMLGDITLDTLDDPNFPRRGYLFEATGTYAYYKDEEGGPLQTYRIGGMAPWTFGRFTLMGLANVARSRDDRGGFSLGGLFNLSGTPPGGLTGSQTGLVAGLAYYKLPGDVLPKALGKNFYAGFSLEAGNAWRTKSDVSYSDLKKAGALFIGFDTLLGPLYFGYGHTHGGPSAFYLLLGRPSDRLGPESR